MVIAPLSTCHRIATGLAAMLAALTMAIAHAAAFEPTAVIAESDRARLTLADYEAEIARLPPGARAEFAASELRLKQYLDNLYVLRVLAADARMAGLDKDPVLARQIATQVDKMLAQAVVERIETAAAAEFDKSSTKYVARAKEIYATGRSRYMTPEQVRAAHILVKIKDGDQDAALRKTEEIRARAVAGADFNQLAREVSDDPTAAKNGGELGYFDAKTMEPEFSAAAFALTRKGEISPPVLSKFGYHIIVLEDRRTATVRGFDEVEPEIMMELRKKAVDDARNENVRKIFSDPTLKVNNDLIRRINLDAAASSDTSRLPSPVTR